MTARPAAADFARGAGLGAAGFNLLPYRQADARRRCRRRLGECACAAVAGAVMAGAALGWDAFSNARDAGRRTALEAELRRLEPLLAERSRLGELLARTRERTLLAARLTAPRAGMSALLEALGGQRCRGIVLYRLRQTPSGVELRARAADSEIPAVWIGRLSRVRGVRSAEVTEMSATRDMALPVDIAARIEWADADAVDATTVQRVRGSRS